MSFEFIGNNFYIPRFTWRFPWDTFFRDNLGDIVPKYRSNISNLKTTNSYLIPFHRFPRASITTCCRAPTALRLRSWYKGLFTCYSFNPSWTCFRAIGVDFLPVQKASKNEESILKDVEKLTVGATYSGLGCCQKFSIRFFVIILPSFWSRRTFSFLIWSRRSFSAWSFFHFKDTWG